MNDPKGLDPEMHRRLQRFGATVDRAAAEAQLARAAREASGDPTAAATVVDLAARRRRVDWRVLVTAAASAVVVAGAIGVLLARSDGSPADRGAAEPTETVVTPLADVAAHQVAPVHSVTTADDDAAVVGTSTVVTDVATTHARVAVGPPPLGLAPTTTAAAGGATGGRQPICSSYTFRVEYSLRLCDKGPAVHLIQQRLVASGAPISVDGYFGPGTEQAVRTFQAAKGLDVDGWVGPDTWRRLVPDAPGVDVDGNGVVDPPEIAPS